MSNQNIAIANITLDNGNKGLVTLYVEIEAEQ